MKYLYPLTIISLFTLLILCIVLPIVSVLECNSTINMDKFYLFVLLLSASLSIVFTFVLNTSKYSTQLHRLEDMEKDLLLLTEEAKKEKLFYEKLVKELLKNEDN